jgi:hypothetical protein
MTRLSLKTANVQTFERSNVRTLSDAAKEITTPGWVRAFLIPNSSQECLDLLLELFFVTVLETQVKVHHFAIAVDDK